MADETDSEKKGTVGEPCRRSVRRTLVNTYVAQRNAKLELKEKVKKVTEILKKEEHERTAAEKAFVKKHPDIVKTSQRNARRLEATKNRVLEIEDEPEILDKKCDQLADLITNADRIVVYTGAGISTAASIPDYRGPNGVWTLLKKGQEPSAQDLSDAEPTFTHMSITKLFRAGLVKHIVSQNCDGLHIRGGYPRYALSEVHGNMYIECCYSCNPHKEYIRLFDVTERTGVRRHTTGRRCRICGSLLTDTIVHFGEKGKIKSPYRWKEAVRAAKNADLILCLGSSLKILRRYTCLWAMDRRPHQRPKLVIVNLQWTPKDEVATLKINGRCDYVMTRVMNALEYEVPEYKRETDPIFKLCTPLRASELKTTSKKILVPPFLPSKTPSKSSKKSRGKKSHSKNNPDDKKVTTASSASTKLKEKEESVSAKEEKKEGTVPFSDLFKKSKIKADWDTPLLAMDISEQVSQGQSVKEETDRIIEYKSESFKTASLKEDNFAQNVCSIKSEANFEPCTKLNALVKPEPSINQTLGEKGKTNSEILFQRKCKAFDVTKENLQNPIDSCHVNEEGVTVSLSPMCSTTPLSEETRDNQNGDTSFVKNESFQDESVQLTQPDPGTVVIDLEIVDGTIDDFSKDQNLLAQVGVSLDNILLINLDSNQLSQAPGFGLERNVQKNHDEVTYRVVVTGDDAGEPMSSPPLPNMKQKPHSAIPSVYDFVHASNENKGDSLFAASSSKSTYSSFCSTATTTTHFNSIQHFDPLPTSAAISNSRAPLISKPPLQGKAVVLSLQQPPSFLTSTQPKSSESFPQAQSSLEWPKPSLSLHQPKPLPSFSPQTKQSSAFLQRSKPSSSFLPQSKLSMPLQQPLPSISFKQAQPSLSLPQPPPSLSLQQPQSTSLPKQYLSLHQPKSSSSSSSLSSSSLPLPKPSSSCLSNSLPEPSLPELQSNTPLSSRQPQSSSLPPQLKPSSCVSLQQPVSVSFQQQGFLDNPGLPFSISHTSTYRPQSQTVWSSTTSGNGLLNSCSTFSINDISSGMQLGSKQHLYQNVPKLSVLFTSKANRHIEKTKCKENTNNHENLLQLLNKPFVEPKNEVNAFNIGLAAKKVISSAGAVSEALNGSSIFDQSYSQTIQSKGKVESLQKNGLSTTLPVNVELEYPKHGESRNLKTNEIHSASGAEKASSLSLAGLHVPEVHTPSTLMHDDINIIMPDKRASSVVRQNASSATTTTNKLINTFSGSHTHAYSNTDTVPLCVLNMDDILKPQDEESHLSMLSPKGIEGKSPMEKDTLIIEVPNPKSSGFFQDITLQNTLISPCHDSRHKITTKEDTQISSKITQPAMGATDKELLIKDDICMTHVCKDSVQSSNNLKMMDSNFEKNRETVNLLKMDRAAEHINVKHSILHDLTKSSDDMSAKSRKWRSTAAVCQPLKPVPQPGPAENEKNNNKRGCNSRKRAGKARSVDRTQSKMNKISSESAPGWFGKGLAIKIKRKRKF